MIIKKKKLKLLNNHKYKNKKKMKYIKNQCQKKFQFQSKKLINQFINKLKIKLIEIILNHIIFN